MKKTLITIAILAGLIGAIYFATTGTAKTIVSNTKSDTATTTQPTRLQQTQQLIEELTEQRKRDQSFIDETNKQIEALKNRREADARIDALMIVKTQLDIEITALETQN